MKARLQYWFLLWTLIVTVLLWELQTTSHASAGTVWDALILGAWVIPLPLALVAVWGLMRYKNQQVPSRLSAPLVFRVVTRGDNVEAVKKTVENIKQTMAPLRTPPDWWIEVITDKPLGIPEQIVVPEDYRTPRGAKWKARALNYALHASRARYTDWIFHLDEESQIDRGTVIGISQFMREHPGKIGQGAILYNRELATNPWLTLGDSLRTGDDVGRFYAQYRAGNCAFGMHGSFILVPNHVEQFVGFDFPPNLCVTEDAYFGLKALERRYSFGWVNGYVYEQSPRTIRDFLKQRRRWFLGIVQVTKGPLPLRTKGILMLSALSWVGSVLVAGATVINFIHPTMVPPAIRLGSDIALGVYVGLYLAGLHLNLQGLDLSTRRKLYYYGLMTISIPIYSMLEMAGVLYGVVRPQLGFEVIKK
jgi:egghead protein (zeste-white 4 protein)